MRIDEDENQLWDIYGIRVVPTVIFFREGKVTGRLDGRSGYGIDEGMLAEALKRAASPVTYSYL